MEKITLFYLKNCPHCKKAQQILSKLLQNPKYQKLEIVRIEENMRPEIANQYDYYYVPTFYVGNKKICEGILSEKQIEEVLERAL